ncbi:MAG: ABC transporter permease [Burkholderiales bacterium]|nr:ABC transporter permease [Burkholderiales bacterium]
MVIYRTYRWLSWLTGGLLFVLWTIVTNLGWVDPVLLPSPQTMFHTTVDFFSNGYAGNSALNHVMASVFRTFTGLAGGIVFGIPIGLLIGYYPAANAVLGPMFSFIRPVPPIAFIPLVILYFGIGEFPKILLIGTAAFWYVVLNTSNGVRSVPIDLIRAALNLGVKPHQLVFRVIFPAALPQVMTGVKTATALSWAIVVAAELVAAQMGLGYMIMDAATFFRVPYVYLGIIIIGIIGLALEFLTNAIETRLLHWRGR